MSLDMAQNASAVTDLVFAGLKVAGYGLVTVCSIFGSHTIKDYLDKEERMKKTVALWRDVLTYLYEKKQKEFGQDGLRCMLNKLEHMETGLNFLEIDLRHSTLWSRTFGEHAGRLRKLNRLIEQTDDDLREQTEKALGKDYILEAMSRLATSSTEPSAGAQATSVGGDQNMCVGRGHVTTPPCVEVARPLPAVLASDRQLQTAQFPAAVPQDIPPFIPWSDYGDDMV